MGLEGFRPGLKRDRPCGPELRRTPVWRLQKVRPILPRPSRYRRALPLSWCSCLESSCRRTSAASVATYRSNAVPGRTCYRAAALSPSNFAFAPQSVLSVCLLPMSSSIKVRFGLDVQTQMTCLLLLRALSMSPGLGWRGIWIVLHAATFAALPIVDGNRAYPRPRPELRSRANARLMAS